MGGYRHWTQQETDTLVRLWRQGTSMTQMSVATNHTFGAIHSKVNTLRANGVDLPRLHCGPQRDAPQFREDDALRIPDDDELLKRLCLHHLGRG